MLGLPRAIGPPRCSKAGPRARRPRPRPGVKEGRITMKLTPGETAALSAIADSSGRLVYGPMLAHRISSRFPDTSEQGAHQAAASLVRMGLAEKRSTGATGYRLTPLGKAFAGLRAERGAVEDRSAICQYSPQHTMDRAPATGTIDSGPIAGAGPPRAACAELYQPSASVREGLEADSG